MKKIFVAAALLTLLPLPAIAEEYPNLELLLTVNERPHTGEPSDRSLRALTAEQDRVRLYTGWKLPILTSPSSYQYQDVGLSAVMEGRITADNRIAIDGSIEVSRVLSSNEPPKLGAFTYSFEALVEDGVETTLAEVPMTGGGTMKITLAASVQR